MQINICDADLGKSQLKRPGTQILDDRVHIGCPTNLAFQFAERFITLDMHSPILETRTLTWLDEAACERWAQELAAHASVREALIELHGTLGAGKTTFTRHLLRALGVAGRIKSPSYAVVEPHEAPGLQAWHFDFYRFNDPQEWEDAGFRDIFAGTGLKVVEWPEKAGELLPTPDLRMHIEPSSSSESLRSVRLDAYTPRGQELIA